MILTLVIIMLELTIIILPLILHILVFIWVGYTVSHYVMLQCGYSPRHERVLTQQECAKLYYHLKELSLRVEDNSRNSVSYLKGLRILALESLEALKMYYVIGASMPSLHRVYRLSNIMTIIIWSVLCLLCMEHTANFGLCQNRAHTHKSELII